MASSSPPFKGASRELSAGSPQPRVTRSSASAARALRRQNPYKRPPAAASAAAKGASAAQTWFPLHGQQCDAKAQQAGLDARTASGPMTRSKRLVCGGEQKKRQEHPALSVMPEQAAPAPDIAEILMQLSELTLTGRQVGADRTGSAAGQTGEGGSAGLSPRADGQCRSPEGAPSGKENSCKVRRWKRQVQRGCGRLRPPTPERDTEPAPSSSQRGKRARDTGELECQNAEQPAAPCNSGEGDAQPLEGAGNNSAQPDVAPQAPRPAKRSRLAASQCSAAPAQPAAAQMEPASAQPFAVSWKQAEDVAPPAAPASIVEAAPTAPGLGRAWARQRYPRKPLFRLPGLPPDACIALDFEYALGGRQDMINPLFLQPKTIKLAYRLQTKRAVEKGMTDTHGRNTYGFAQNWKRPPRSSLKIARGPSDDPSISLQLSVEKAARIKAKIIKENGGVEPTAGHPQYGRYHRLVWICQGVEDPMLWTRPFSKLEAL